MFLERIGQAGLVAVALFALSCGGKGSPVGPTVASPTASATVAPTGTPEPPVGAAVCSLGPGTEDAVCGPASTHFLAAIDAAIETVIGKHPDYFDFTRAKTPGNASYVVLNKAGFVSGVVDALRGQGFCAELDYTTQELVSLKNENGFSEQYQVYVVVGPTGYIARRGYLETCRPAAFPLEVSPNAPPPGTGCGWPFPPEIRRFGGKIHTRQIGYVTLDSTPLVVDGAYCQLIGFTDGRTICPVRTEGSNDRVACENWRVGTAKDTGRPGPTWTREDGSYCTGVASGCENHPDNQYGLIVYTDGVYKMCAENGICGSVPVDWQAPTPSPTP
jgi:hypothetical protein